MYNQLKKSSFDCEKIVFKNKAFSHENNMFYDIFIL